MANMPQIRMMSKSTEKRSPPYMDMGKFGSMTTKHAGA